MLDLKTNYTEFKTRIFNSIPKSSKVIVAFSGGQDSMTLLSLLNRFTKEEFDYNLQIYPVYCDHQWELDKPLGDFNTNKVKEYFNLDLKVIKGNPKGTEGDSRKWRYNVLKDYANEKSSHYILTGHTKSDRAETFLFNLMRGSSSRGLSALRAKRKLGNNLFLFRPIIYLKREDTKEYCNLNNLNYWEDPYNQYLTYSRNSIRLKVIPLLEKVFHSKIQDNIVHTMETLAEDDDYLNEIALTWLNTHTDLDLDELNKLNICILKRVLSKYIHRNYNFYLNRQDLNSLTNLVCSKNKQVYIRRLKVKKEKGNSNTEKQFLTFQKQ